VKRVFAMRHLDVWFLVAMTAALLLALWLVEPGWFTSQLVQLLVAENAPLALVAMAMTFSIISRNIDLSPGAMIALTGAVIGLVTASHGLALALLAGLGTALGVALLNGLLVARVGLNAIMVTIGTYIWARGLALGANNGTPLPVASGLPSVVNASLWGFTLTAPVVLAAYLLGWFLLSRTKMGRYTYAIGGDPLAARRAGLNVARYTLAIFLLMGAMIFVATVITVGQLGAATPDAATGLEFEAIIAVVIGGTSLAGGEGHVGRTAVGVVFLSILKSGLSNLGLTQAAYELYSGIALLSVLSVQVWLRRVVANQQRRREDELQMRLRVEGTAA
jgi:ribose transport system permease protein